VSPAALLKYRPRGAIAPYRLLPIRVRLLAPVLRDVGPVGRPFRMASRILKLQRADVCVLCGTNIDAHAEAWWDAGTKTVTCLACHRRTSQPQNLKEPELLERGHAGASARREYERRRTSREASVHVAHRRIGGLLLWLQDAPQHETAFRTGELGEVAVGESLDRRTAEGPAIILHDRRMPRARGNIDHVAIAPAGVFVIDAKAHSGKVQIDRPLFGSTKWRIAGRDRTELIDGLDRQVAAVRDTLDRAGHAAVPIQGVLCFTNADLPLVRTLRIRGHVLLYRKALAARLNADGKLNADEIEAIAHGLARELPRA
jgi:Nuclease-related domain